MFWHYSFDKFLFLKVTKLSCFFFSLIIQVFGLYYSLDSIFIYVFAYICNIIGRTPDDAKVLAKYIACIFFQDPIWNYGLFVCYQIFHSNILPNFGPDRKYRQKQPKATQRRPKNDPKMTQRRPKEEPKTTQRRTKNERVLRTVFHYFYETNITKFIKSKPKLKTVWKSWKLYQKFLKTIKNPFTILTWINLYNW